VMAVSTIFLSLLLTASALKAPPLNLKSGEAWPWSEENSAPTETTKVSKEGHVELTKKTKVSKCAKEKLKRQFSVKVPDDCKILPDFLATGKKKDIMTQKWAYHNITKEETWKTWHHSYKQNDFRLQQAMNKLMSGSQTEKVRVVTLGGSITWGHGCQTTQHWVKSLNKSLTSTYGSRVEVTNLAQPATTGAHVIANFARKQLKDPLTEADVIIVEYQYNELFTRDNIERQHDKLSFMLLNLPKKPAVLFFDLEGPPQYGRKWKGWGKLPPVEKSLHYNAAARFQIPIVWFADVEREMGFTVDWLAPTHPNCAAHEVFAKVVHDVFQSTMVNVCEHGVQGQDIVLPHMENEAWNRCVENRALQAHALDGQKSFPVKSAGDWSFKEDVPGKPGWIASEGSKKEIVFTALPIKFGGLTIQYLQTYENAGAITCKLEQAGTAREVKSMTLSGLWEECVSLESTSQFFDIPAGHYDLRCQSDGGKFKLTGLQTC